MHAFLPLFYLGSFRCLRTLPSSWPRHCLLVCVCHPAHPVLPDPLYHQDRGHLCPRHPPCISNSIHHVHESRFQKKTDTFSMTLASLTLLIALCAPAYMMITLMGGWHKMLSTRSISGCICSPFHKMHHRSLFVWFYVPDLWSVCKQRHLHHGCSLPPSSFPIF